METTVVSSVSPVTGRYVTPPGSVRRTKETKRRSGIRKHIRPGVLVAACCSSQECTAHPGPGPRGVAMPQYAALIYTEDLDWSSSEQAEVTKQYIEFGANNAAS